MASAYLCIPGAELGLWYRDQKKSSSALSANIHNWFYWPSTEVIFTTASSLVYTRKPRYSAISSSSADVILLAASLEAALIDSDKFGRAIGSWDVLPRQCAIAVLRLTSRCFFRSLIDNMVSSSFEEERNRHCTLFHSLSSKLRVSRKLGRRRDGLTLSDGLGLRFLC